MNNEEKILWQDFLIGRGSQLKQQERELIAKLHAKYFNHKYHIPCGCNPNTIKGWITDLNGLYDTK